MTELLGIWYMHVVSHIMITRLSYAVITCYIENLCFTVYLRMIDWLMAFCFVQAFVACLNAFNVQDSLLFYKLYLRIYIFLSLCLLIKLCCYYQYTYIYHDIFHEVWAFPCL